LVPGLFALPLRADRDGAATWVATGCLVDPAHRDNSDPRALTGAALLDRVELTEHVVQRYQQRCGGHPDLATARQELRALLAPTVRARERPPGWARTKPAPLFLVAGAQDEYVVPCHRSGGVKGFTAATLIVHESALRSRPPAVRTGFGGWIARLVRLVRR
jgi:hypothetical protein